MGECMKFVSFEVILESEIPKRISITMRPEVFIVTFSEKTLSKADLHSVRNFEESDALSFDYKFSDSLLISCSDLFSGKHSIKTIEYNIPDDVAIIIEIYEVNDRISEKNYFLVNAYKIVDNKAEKINAAIFKNKKEALDFAYKIRKI